MTEINHRGLVSYVYMRPKGLCEYLDFYFGTDRDDMDMFIDSGAFSAMTQGSEVDVGTYGRWLAADWRAAGVSVIANLDVIGDEEATWRNHQILTNDFGIPVLPVVHVGADMSWFDRYLDAGYDYIALGGLVGKKFADTAPWVIQAFKRVAGRAGLHGFGIGNQDVILDLPWFSVDSSSWVGRRFGSVHLHDGKRLRRFMVSDRARVANNSRTMEFTRLAREHGFDPEVLRVGDEQEMAYRSETRASAIAWKRLEQQHRRRHGLIHRPSCRRSIEANGPCDCEPGLRLYLACTDPISHVDARNIHRDRRSTIR